MDNEEKTIYLFQDSSARGASMSQIKYSYDNSFGFGENVPEDSTGGGTKSLYINDDGSLNMTN